MTNLMLPLLRFMFNFATLLVQEKASKKKTGTII